MSAGRVVKLRKSTSWVLGVLVLWVPFVAFLVVSANGQVLAATIAVVATACLGLLPVVRVVDDEVVMSCGPFRRRLPLSGIDEFVHLVSGKYEGLGYSPASTFKVEAIWGSRFTSRRHRIEWLATLRQELARVRPFIPSLEQRAADAGVPHREMKAITIAGNAHAQRVVLYDSDATAGVRPRYSCLLPADAANPTGLVVEMFGNTVDGDVVLRLPWGQEVWPMAPLSPPPYREHPWPTS